MKLYTKKDLNEYFISLTYDDISLVPTEVSRIKTRSEANTKSEFLGVDVSIPILSSPMDTVSGIDMVKELKNLGCIGILNRFDSSLDTILSNEEEMKYIQAASIGVNAELSIIEKLAAKDKIICIDTANANNKMVLDKTAEIKKHFKNVKVIIGNIASGVSLKQLSDAGADAVRVGIGSGSVCTTSIQTGIGIGQVSSLLDVYFAKQKIKSDIKIIADGGIKSPGDVAKALALGADAVMLGRMIAGS
ncbi:MAG TPA: IMP dehydrogenase, partial [Ignavibacteriales bacterium]|nr:IMP dehydrogenase [Ignavibacteriales bacterium]